MPPYLRPSGATWHDGWRTTWTAFASEDDAVVVAADEGDVVDDGDAGDGEGGGDANDGDSDASGASEDDMGDAVSDISG